MHATTDRLPDAQTPGIEIAASPMRPVRFAFPDGGDDIARAREFCDSARARMDRIIDAPRDEPGDAGRDPHWLCEHLAAMQQGAKRARARAVYRAAQDVMGLIHCNGPHLPIDWTQVDGRLLTLNKLLLQYTNGVEEIEDACRLDEDVDTADLASDADTDTAAHRRARDTLRSLLPHASDAERALLHRLMGEGPAAPSAPRFALEDDLPELMQRLLGHGRDYGKTLSVSYALDGVMLEAPRRDAVLDQLWDVLAPLIAASLPLQGVGHLDITAAGERLRISGSGFERFELRMAEARTTPKPTPSPKPMITPETETALRAQLDALLDAQGPSL